MCSACSSKYFSLSNPIFKSNTPPVYNTVDIIPQTSPLGKRKDEKKGRNDVEKAA
jgi:hypothetical protein